MANKETIIIKLKVAHEKTICDKKIQKLEEKLNKRKISETRFIRPVLHTLPIEAFEVLLKPSVIDEIRTAKLQGIPSKYKGTALKIHLTNKLLEKCDSALKIAKKLDKKWEGPGKLKIVKSLYSDKFEQLFQREVPSEGCAKSLDGEVIRATMRIAYRWHNDGDTILQHSEATISASRFLAKHYPCLIPFLNKLKVKYSIANDNDNGTIKYQNDLNALVDKVYLLIKDSNFELANTEDFLDY